MSAADHVNPLQFYHSTDAELNPGDVIEPGHKIKGAGSRLSSADFPELGHRNFAWMTTVKPHPKAGGGYGKNNYEVEPLGLHHQYSFDLARTGKVRSPADTSTKNSTWVSLAGAKVIRKVNDDEPRIGDVK